MKCPICEKILTNVEIGDIACTECIRKLIHKEQTPLINRMKTHIYNLENEEFFIRVRVGDGVYYTNAVIENHEHYTNSPIYIMLTDAPFYTIIPKRTAYILMNRMNRVDAIAQTRGFSRVIRGELADKSISRRLEKIEFKNILEQSRRDVIQYTLQIGRLFKDFMVKKKIKTHTPTNDYITDEEYTEHREEFIKYLEQKILLNGWNSNDFS